MKSQINQMCRIDNMDKKVKAEIMDKIAKMWILSGGNSHEWAWLIWSIRDRIMELEEEGASNDQNG